MRMKLGIACVLVLALFCGFEIYYDDGIVGVTKKPNHVFVNPGCICHDQNLNVRVWISGPESLAVGQEALYTISVAKDSNIAAGFNVAAFLGALGVYDSAGTQLMRPDGFDTLELTHVDPKLAHDHDTVSWSFLYRAPLTVGAVDTLYANGNSVDTSQDPSGDAWNFGSNFLVRVIGPNAVSWQEPLARTYRLLQNYPNPFNPSTTIRYEIPVDAKVELKLFDISGREVCTLVNELQSAGLHEILFHTQLAGSLASGVYLYRILATPHNSAIGSFVDVKKMIFLR